MEELTNSQKEVFIARVATLQRCIDEINTLSKGDFICVIGATLASLNYHMGTISPSIEEDGN